MKEKIVYFVKKHKIVLTVGLLIILVAVFFLSRKGEEVPNISPTALPTGQSTSQLYVVRKEPAESTFSSMWSVEPIKFVFNKDIRPETLEYSIDPPTETKIKFEYTSPNEITIIPLFGWTVDQQYTLTILSLQAISGETIVEPVQTNFKRTFNPQDIPDIVY